MNFVVYSEQRRRKESSFWVFGRNSRVRLGSLETAFTAIELSDRGSCAAVWTESRSTSAYDRSAL